MHQRATSITSWAYHGRMGWHIGLAMEQFRYAREYITVGIMGDSLINPLVILRSAILQVQWLDDNKTW